MNTQTRDTQTRVGRDLTEGNILSQLIVFVIPILLTNIIQQLYNIVDLAVIGHFAGNVGTVGVSAGGEIPNLLLFISTSFAAAGQIYISQQVGGKDHSKIKDTIGTLLTMTFLTSVVFTIVSLVFCKGLLHVINTPEEAFSEALAYMVISSVGLPFVFGYNAICGVLRGMGESKWPLVFVSISAVVNIFLDLLFVAVMDLSAAGTAYATVIAQIISFLASWIFLYKNRSAFNFDFKLKSFTIHREHAAVLIRIGIPHIVQNVCIHVTQLYCNAQVNDYGLVESAVNSVGNKVVRIINITTNSIDTGASVIVGQNLSARKFDRVKKTVYLTLGICSVICILNCLCAIFIPETLFGIFSNDKDVIAYSAKFMRIAIITLILSVPQGAFGSVVTGSGNAKLNMLIGLLDGVILRSAISLVFANTFNMGVVGYFYGNSLPRLAPAIISMAYFFGGKWKTRRLLTERSSDGSNR